MYEEIKDTNSENSTVKERQIKKQLGSREREQVELNKESSYAQIHSFHVIHFSCTYARIWDPESIQASVFEKMKETLSCDNWTESTK